MPTSDTSSAKFLSLSLSLFFSIICNLDVRSKFNHHDFIVARINNDSFGSSLATAIAIVLTAASSATLTSSKTSSSLPTASLLSPRTLSSVSRPSPLAPPLAASSATPKTSSKSLSRSTIAISSRPQEIDRKPWNNLGKYKYTIQDGDAYSDWVSCVRFSPNSLQPMIVSSWDRTLNI
ncbi:hypothetical protein ACSBR2_004614 [Camellia fascicularis]